MTLARKIIRGSGGGKSGGGGSSTPTEATDSLRSKQYARVLDLLSEGEIGGLVDGLKSIYLNNVPIQNEDGSYNFNGVNIVTRNGTQTQEYIQGFPAVESETGVGVEVTNTTPVVRSLVDTTLSAARVTLSIPQLTLQDVSNGNLGGTSVEIAIDLQSNGGGYVAQPTSKTWSGQSIAAATYTALQCYGIGLKVVTSLLSEGVYVTFDIEYKTTAAGSWAPLATYSFTSHHNKESEASRDFYSPSLSLNDYMIRVTKTGGSIGSPGVSASKGYRLDNSYTDVITGKTTSRYQRSYVIPLVGSPPWDIKVRRITADSGSAALQNKTFWDSYTGIVDAKLNYPNSALSALQIDASQFSSIPTRGFEIDGLLVRIPSNYNPLSRAYTGVWDGTFVTAWTNNPAWCYYDLATNPRYGLGAYIDPTQIDKWALYTIAQYCDELVPDGFGGMEPRFTCNLYLQSQVEAYTLLVNMASIFRAMAWWGAGTITVSQDSPADPVAQFTAANVINGTFNYSGSSRTVRHTVALIGWNNPDQAYEQQVEYVEDPEGIVKYGVVSTGVTAFGCTSRGQAHRLGRWLLYSERLETEVVVFQTGLDGAFVYPGAVIQTVDPFRSGRRYGGRVSKADKSLITLDDSITIESGKSYSLTCQQPNGNLETREISNYTLQFPGYDNYIYAMKPVVGLSSAQVTVECRLTVGTLVNWNNWINNNWVNNGWLLFSNAAGSLIFGVGESPVQHNATSAVGIVQEGQTYLLTGTYDGITVRAYLDGIEVASFVPTNPNLVLDINADIIIGNYGSGSKMIEARIYNRALSATEIYRRFQYEDIRTGLAVQYLFNKGSGTTVEDLSGNRNVSYFINNPTWVQQGLDVASPRVTVYPEFTVAPQPQSVWMLTASDLVPETWRVVAAAEVNKGQLEITALEYNVDKFLAVEYNIILEPPPTMAIELVPNPVSELDVVESLYLAALGVVGVRAQLSWHGNAVRYLISYRLENENWIQAETRTTSIELLSLIPGIYEFTVVASNALGIRSTPVTLEQEIYGKLLIPSDVTGFSIIKVSGLALAQLDLHPDLDVRVGGQIIIRHSPLTSGATWNDGIIFGEYNGDVVSGFLPLTTGTYMAKAKDSSENYSANAAIFVATEGMITGFTTVATSTQHPTFSGSKTDLVVTDNSLRLNTNANGVLPFGTYLFTTYLDMTTVATRRFEANVIALSYNVGDLIDSRLDLIDDWTTIDGSTIDGCDITLYVATTDDNPAGSPTWGAWTPFFVSDFTCRAAKFKVEFVSDGVTHNIQVSSLVVKVKVPA